ARGRDRMNEVPRPTRAYWICQIAGWGAYALMGVGMSHAFGYGGPRMDLTTVTGTLVALGVTHLWREVMLRRGMLAMPLGRMLPRLLAGTVGAALACELSVWAIGLFVTRVYTMKTSTAGIMFATSANWVFTMLLWTAVYVGAHAFGRWRDSEIQRLRLTVLARD